MSTIEHTHHESGVTVSLRLPPFLVDNGKEVNSAVQHLFSEDDVAFSLCSEDAQSSALDLVDIAFAKAKATARNAERLKHIKKTVMFAMNIHSADKLFVRPGKLTNGNIELFPHNETGDIDVESVLHADVLLIAPLEFDYDPAQVTTIGEVEVTIVSQNPNIAQQIGFWTGGTYFLSNGYSVMECYSLGDVKNIQLGGNLPKVTKSVKNSAEITLLVEDEEPAAV